MKKGWEVKKLGDVCQMYQPKTITGKEMVANGAYPVFGANGIIGRYDKYNHEDPQLLITCRGATCGSVNISEPKSWVTGNAMVVRSKSGFIENRFLEYFFRGGIEISKVITGAAQPQITRTNLEPIEICYPTSLAEQQRIVGVLDEALASLAIAQANTEKNRQNVRALFESHLQSIFTQRGEGWVETTLPALCDPLRIITYGVIKLGDETPSGIPCLRTSNVRWLRIDTEGMKRIAPSLSAEYSRTILQGGEVLVNVRGTLGGVAVVEPEMAGWNVSREVAVVPVDHQRINPSFLAYLIGSGVSQQWLGGVKKGAAYTGINIEDLRLLPIAVPKHSEQKRIVAELDAIASETQRLEGIYQRKLEALAALKKSLLQQAFSGQL